MPTASSKTRQSPRPWMILSALLLMIMGVLGQAHLWAQEEAPAEEAVTSEEEVSADDAVSAEGAVIAQEEAPAREDASAQEEVTADEMNDSSLVPWIKEPGEGIESPASEAGETIREEATAVEEASEESYTAKESPPLPSIIEEREGTVQVYVIPITEAITDPQVFIMRRGIKEAIENGVTDIVIDLDTPGGAGGPMLEMMEIIDRFEGKTYAFVNEEAISAGAIIASAADEIYFTPRGLMGSADVIQASGEEIPSTLKEKIQSYIRAKIRSMNEDHPLRAKVLRAMMEQDYVLEIDGKVLEIDGEAIKPEGELLTLTARQAVHMVGDPAEPLLASGIYEDVEALLTAKFGSGGYEVRTFEVTWSENLAKFMASIAPVLLGLGFLLLIVEFKTPSFGLIGSAGIALIAIVFLSNSVAGLAGYEPLLLFGAGVVLLVLEIFFVAGVGILAIGGALCILGALFWSLADVWPTDTGGISISMDGAMNAVETIGMTMLLFMLGLLVVMRFFPHSPFLRRLVLATTSATANEVAAGGGLTMSGVPGSSLPEVGATGVAVTDMHPSGEVEIEDRRFQATVELEPIERGTPIRVTRRSAFALKVERVS